MASDRIEPTQEEIIMGFVASCIEWAAYVTKEDYLTMFQRMDKVGLIDNYILKYYNVLHLESRANITKDVLETLSAWEKRVEFIDSEQL